jgi:Na+-driven multidrug efflux pump
MALQFSITAIGSVILQSAVNSLGTTVVASVTAGTKVHQLLSMPMNAIGATAATYCGQNLGAQRIDRVRSGMRSIIAVMLTYGVISASLLVLFGANLSMLFLDEPTPEVFAYVRQLQRTWAMFYFPLGMTYVFRNSLQGLGYSFVAMVGGVGELIARSSVAFLLVGPFGFDGVCMANPVAWTAGTLMMLPIYFRAMKKLDDKYSVRVPEKIN